LRSLPLCAAVAALVTACGDDVARFAYPLDGTLRLNQLQAKGTHNSYHVETVAWAPWQYTHAPLDEQLEKQGVRQLELDVWFIEPGGSEPAYFEVHHSPPDTGTTCDRLSTCLAVVAGWSRAHPAHEPLLILLEPKDDYDPARATAFFDMLEKNVLASFPRANLLTPARVRGDAATLGAALATRGWPTLGEVRGQVFFALLDGGGHRDAYRQRRDPLIFTAGGPDDPEAGIWLVDDPIEHEAEIRAAVAQGLLVRTRSDVDSVEPRAGDRTKLERALASGAQFISTDYPAPVSGVPFVVDIPGGTPARCNPVSAPPGCSAEAIENPAFLK
jgi:hypothetical protein